MTLRDKGEPDIEPVQVNHFHHSHCPGLVKMTGNLAFRIQLTLFYTSFLDLQCDIHLIYKALLVVSKRQGTGR